MNRTYGYYDLEIVSEKLSIPLKLFNTIETEPKVNFKQGKLNQETGDIDEIKTVRVIMKEGKIQETVGWSGNETFIEKSGKLVEIPSEVSELIKLDKEKRKTKTIEFIGIFPKSELSWEKFNGRQFITEVGTKIKKQILLKENALYNCLIKILKDKFMLVRFFTRSGQELGALYSINNELRISGLYDDNSLKTFNKNNLSSKVSENSIETIEKLLMKIGNNSKPKFKLDWKDYYQTCIENNGITNKSYLKLEPNFKDTGDDELSKLLETLV